MVCGGLGGEGLLMLSRFILRISVWLVVFGVWLACDKVSMRAVKAALIAGSVKPRE